MGERNNRKKGYKNDEKSNLVGPQILAMGTKTLQKQVEALRWRPKYTKCQRDYCSWFVFLVVKLQILLKRTFI
jgi:hypothetical protein